jgi:polysaccharide biosynthesis protein PslF
VSSGPTPVCLVSTYPPQRCGIASYTAELARALAGCGAPVVVLSERGPDAGRAHGMPSFPAWDRRQDWVAPVLEAVSGIGATVVHLQHTPDTLGWDDRVPRLLDALARRGVATAITLHTVHTSVSGPVEGRLRPARHHRALAACAGAVVVHGVAGQADTLLRHGVAPEKIVVIPHGTAVASPPAAAESRERLGIAHAGPLLVYFGFIHVFKNVHTLLRATARLAPRVPAARLLVAGSIQNRGLYNRIYLRLCRRMTRARALAGRVQLREGFVPPAQVADLYGAADVVLLPHSQRYGSASGVLHQALGAGRLVLCSRSPKFAEVGESVSPDLLVPTHDPDAWAGRIELLLGDEALREALLARVRAWATETSWPRAAARHLALYAMLQRSRPAPP